MVSQILQWTAEPEREQHKKEKTKEGDQEEGATTDAHASKAKLSRDTKVGSLLLKTHVLWLS